MGSVSDETRGAFLAASEFFVGLVAATPQGCYDHPGLGHWSVLELIAHGNRAHTTIVDYVERPIDPGDVPADYFSDHSIRERARLSMAALQPDPVAAVATAASRARELVTASDLSTPVGSPVGTMTLGQYLPSRTAELVIHALDLARAAEVETSAPDQSVIATLEFLVGLAAKQGHAETLIAAATGRGRLPNDFNLF